MRITFGYLPPRELYDVEGREGSAESSDTPFGGRYTGRLLGADRGGTPPLPAPASLAFFVASNSSIQSLEGTSSSEL